MSNIPFLLKPAAKDYLWGGSRLNDDFNKEIPMNPLVDSIAIFGILSIPIFRIEKDMVFPPFVKRYFLNVNEFSGLLATG